MLLTNKQLYELEQMRRILLVEIANGKGMEIAFRSENLEFEEPNATILQDQFEMRLFNGQIISIFDKVRIDWSHASKWATMLESHSLLYFLTHHFSTRGGDHSLRLLAFVRVPGKVRGGARCEGIFCVLSKLDQGDSVYEDTEFICRGQEIGRERGKVMLYPIECLVPVTAQSEAERPRSVSEEYADELKYIAGLG